MDRICHFHSEYMKSVSQLELDQRMLATCRNKSQRNQLSIYISVCLELESNARIGPFMLALNAVTGAAHLSGAASELLHSARALSWPLVLALGVLFIVCPSLIISGMRRRPTAPIWQTDVACCVLQPSRLRLRKSAPLFGGRREVAAGGACALPGEGGRVRRRGPSPPRRPPNAAPALLQPLRRPRRQRLWHPQGFG